MLADRELVIVNPVKEQEPFRHPDVEREGEIVLHWDLAVYLHRVSEAKEATLR